MKAINNFLLKFMLFTILFLLIFTNNISNSFDEKYIYPQYSKYNGGKQPILGSEDTGSLFDPHIIYDDKKYKMYVSKRDIGSIVLYESSDGIHWNDNFYIVLKPNDDSYWENIVNRASVIHYKNKYYMYYTGQYGKENIEHSEIGLAISKDGYNFKRYSDKPIISLNNIKKVDSVMNPYVFFDEDEKIFKMYYASGETFEPDNICYATSIDGINWKQYSNNPIFTKNENKNTLDSFKVGAADVKKISKNKYIMYYIGYKNLKSANIFFATSKDGIHWNRSGNKPILKSNKDGWDSSAIYKPSLIYNIKDKKWYLYYNGRKDTSEYIGLAISNNDNLK